MSEAPPQADPYAGLHCPGCEYPLRGLTEPRCPECGTPFDADQLRRRRSSLPLHVRPWHDLRELGLARAYAETGLAVMLRPRRFADALPRVAASPGPASFAWASRGLAALIFLVHAAVVASFSSAGTNVLLQGIGILVASVVFEALMAWTCFLLCKRRLDVPFDRFQSWHDLMHCGSAFLPASAASGLLATGLALLLRTHVPPVLPIVLMLCVFCWWWYCLACMIETRARKPRPWAITSAGVLGVALLAAFVGQLAAVLLAELRI